MPKVQTLLGLYVGSSEKTQGQMVAKAREVICRGNKKHLASKNQGTYIALSQDPRPVAGLSTSSLEGFLLCIPSLKGWSLSSLWTPLGPGLDNEKTTSLPSLL